jgi:[ribosomal protein S5]-alanine N-acetyltransferase
VWGIEPKESGKIIGSIGLIDDRKREYNMIKMIGYAIGEAYWGQGLMTEAVNEVIKFGFEELSLAAISAYCFPFNKRSKNVLMKCNFEYEGTLKMAEKIFNGNIFDNDCYFLTAQSYYSK